MTTATLFHYAPTAARDSILTHGLDWTKAPNAAVPIVGYDEDDNEVELPKANYLYTSRASVVEALPDGFEVWEVDAAGLALEVDPYEDGEALMCADPIPPARLRAA